MDARQLHKRQYEAEVKMKPTVLGLNLSFTTYWLCSFRLFVPRFPHL